jgi:hypothetical protein
MVGLGLPRSRSRAGSEVQRYRVIWLKPECEACDKSAKSPRARPRLLILANFTNKQKCWSVTLVRLAAGQRPCFARPYKAGVRGSRPRAPTIPTILATERQDQEGGKRKPPARGET